MADPHTLQTAFRSHALPLPSLTFLRSLSTRNPPPPQASLIATARTRLLLADLTTPDMLDPAYVAEHILPSSVINRPEIDSARLKEDVVVQVLDVENISKSKWEVVEELERLERGEGMRGREVVRVRDEDGDGDGEGGEGEGTQGGQRQGGGDGGERQRGGGAGGGGGGGNQQGPAKATHRLVLQDCKGQKVIAIELKRVEQIVVGKTQIGEKMMLRRGTKIARGLVLLEPELCAMLGGKVDAWNKVWLEGRLARLKEAAEVR